MVRYGRSYRILNQQNFKSTTIFLPKNTDAIVHLINVYEKVRCCTAVAFFCLGHSIQIKFGLGPL